MYFELIIICISANHRCQSCCACVPAILGSAAMLCASPATRSAIVKNSSNPKAFASSMRRFLTLIPDLRIIYRTMWSRSFFRPLCLNGAGSLVASAVQISGSCSLLHLNSTNSVSSVALSSDVSLNASCFRSPSALLTNESSSAVSYSSSEESKGVTEL